MAQSVIMIYESLEAIKSKRDYWKTYIDHYEKFWDGPATPQSSWWGREYDEFRISLAERLGLTKEHINNAFFIRDENNRYYVCPVGDEVNMNIMASENMIPYEWFLMFDPREKDYFYTHTGFGAIQQDTIYYRTKISDSLARLEKSSRILAEKLNDEIGKDKYPGISSLIYLQSGIENIKNWLTGFSGEAIVILNYGEICGLIDRNSFSNENSVGEIHSVLDMLNQEDFSGADTSLKVLNAKWSEIYVKSSSDTNNKVLQ